MTEKRFYRVAFWIAVTIAILGFVGVITVLAGAPPPDAIDVVQDPGFEEVGTAGSWILSGDVEVSNVEPLDGAYSLVFDAPDLHGHGYAYADFTLEELEPGTVWLFANYRCYPGVEYIPQTSLTEVWIATSQGLTVLHPWDAYEVEIGEGWQLLILEIDGLFDLLPSGAGRLYIGSVTNGGTIFLWDNVHLYGIPQDEPIVYDHQVYLPFVTLGQ